MGEFAKLCCPIDLQQGHVFRLDKKGGKESRSFFWLKSVKLRIVFCITQSLFSASMIEFGVIKLNDWYESFLFS